MNEKAKIKAEAENERKAKEGRRLFYIFGGLIVILIALMFIIDYCAQEQATGHRTVHNAAEPG